MLIVKKLYAIIVRLASTGYITYIYFLFANSLFVLLNILVICSVMLLVYRSQHNDLLASFIGSHRRIMREKGSKVTFLMYTFQSYKADKI